MKIEQLLKEATVGEYYGPRFEEFLKKYKKQKKDASLFVRFSSYADNNLDKRFQMTNTGHDDPAGFYGYPLSYVVDYPMDIHYGANAKYLQVVKLHPNANVLWLQTLEYRRLEVLFRKATGEDFDYWVTVYRKIYGEKSKSETTLRKIWFRLIQWDFQQLPENATNSRDVVVLSPEKQNKLFVSLGFDAIVDDAKSRSKAIINPREPEQICILNRKFDILESILIHGKREQRPVSTTRDMGDLDFKLKEIANRTALAIGDKFVGSDKAETANAMGFRFYRTVSGRLIGVKAASTDYSMTLIDDSKYRKHKKEDDYAFTIKIISERGTNGLIETDAFYDSQDAVDEIADLWKNNDVIDPEYKEGGYESFKDYIDHRNAIKRDKDNVQFRAFLKDDYDRFREYADRVLIPKLEEIQPISFPLTPANFMGLVFMVAARFNGNNLLKTEYLGKWRFPKGAFNGLCPKEFRNEPCDESAIVEYCESLGERLTVDEQAYEKSKDWDYPFRGARNNFLRNSGEHGFDNFTWVPYNKAPFGKEFSPFNVFQSAVNLLNYQIIKEIPKLIEVEHNEA